MEISGLQLNDHNPWSDDLRNKQYITYFKNHVETVNAKALIHFMTNTTLIIA